jgi:hypothetical protein
MLWLVDRADGLLGIRGDWQLAGPARAVKRITYCPLAGDLQAVPAFCTRLGVVMGQAAFRTYAPNVPFNYNIPQTLSQGGPYCEYVLSIAQENKQAV